MPDFIPGQVKERIAKRLPQDPAHQHSLRLQPLKTRIDRLCRLLKEIITEEDIAVVIPGLRKEILRFPKFSKYGLWLHHKSDGIMITWGVSTPMEKQETKKHSFPILQSLTLDLP